MGEHTDVPKFKNCRNCQDGCPMPICYSRRQKTSRFNLKLIIHFKIINSKVFFFSLRSSFSFSFPFIRLVSLIVTDIIYTEMLKFNNKGTKSACGGCLAGSRMIIRRSRIMNNSKCWFSLFLPFSFVVNILTFT